MGVMESFKNRVSKVAIPLTLAFAMAGCASREEKIQSQYDADMKLYEQTGVSPVSRNACPDADEAERREALQQNRGGNFLNFPTGIGTAVGAALGYLASPGQAAIAVLGGAGGAVAGHMIGGKESTQDSAELRGHCMADQAISDRNGGSRTRRPYSTSVYPN